MSRDADHATRADAAEWLVRFRREGFALVGPLVDAGTVEGMRAALDRTVREDLHRWSGNPWYRDQWMVHNLLLRDDLFLDFLRSPRLHGFLDEALSPHCILYAYTSSSLPPEGHNYSRRIHIDAQARTIDCVTNVGVLVALDDFTPANGATRFLPGSHRELEAPSTDHFMAESVQACPKAGEAVVFNARTWHYGGENRTSTPRHAITLNACRPWMKQRFDYPSMLDARQLERLGPVGRRFIGMESRVPRSLEEYYVAPENRLYKPGQY
jgi:hypothetical protein